MLKKTAEEKIGRPVEKVVLAVPVGFDLHQIRATRRAAELAGLQVLRTIHEPTAAAMAYGLHQHAHAMTVMVYDLGGGTLDVSILNLNNGIFEVMSAAGDNQLGGQDFTEVLVEKLVKDISQRLGEGSEARIRGEREWMRALRDESERLKITMNDECDCSGEFFDGDEGRNVNVKLPSGLESAGPLTYNRDDFEKAASHLLQRAIAPVQEVLRKLEMRPNEVDELVLVGGSTRLSKVRKNLLHFFGKEPNCMVSPEEAVAQGTAIQAAILTDQKKISVGATEAALHVGLT